jgi:hypothetical protein
MTKAFEKTADNYTLLYKFSTGPYKETKSYTTSKTFVPDPILGEQPFIQDPTIKKSEFIADPKW